MYQTISADLRLVEVQDNYPKRFGHLALGDSFSCLTYKGKTDKVRLPRTSETSINTFELKNIAFGCQVLTLKLSNLVMIIHGRSLVPIHTYVKGHPQLLWNVIGKISKVELVMQTHSCKEFLKSV